MERKCKQWMRVIIGMMEDDIQCDVESIEGDTRLRFAGKVNDQALCWEADKIPGDLNTMRKDIEVLKRELRRCGVRYDRIPNCMDVFFETDDSYPEEVLMMALIATEKLVKGAGD